MTSGPPGPVVSSETRKRQKEARDTLAQDVDSAVNDFISSLNVIAEKHARCAFFFFSFFSRRIDR